MPALIEPATYYIGFKGGKLNALAPANVKRSCMFRYIGGEFHTGKGWTFPSTGQIAAQLLEILPTANIDGYVGRMAASYWRNVAEGKAEHYVEIGFALSPTEPFRQLDAAALRRKYGDEIIDWIEDHQQGGTPL